MSQKIKDKARTLREQREQREERKMQNKALRKLADVQQLLNDLRPYSANSSRDDNYRQASHSVVTAYEQIYASLTPPKPKRPTHLRLV